MPIVLFTTIFGLACSSEGPDDGDGSGGASASAGATGGSSQVGAGTGGQSAAGGNGTGGALSGSNCYAESCDPNTEYCYIVEINGTPQIAACRDLPAECGGVADCGCVSDDAGSLATCNSTPECSEGGDGLLTALCK